MEVGTGAYRYRIIPNWGIGAEGKSFGGVITGIAVDGADRVYLARRSPPAILVYDRRGAFVDEWKPDTLMNPHGVFADHESCIWVTDTDNHTIHRFSQEGDVRLLLGTPGKPGNPGEPFNRPTKAVVSPDGELFVSDGYGQSRVHRFTLDGRHLASWGSPGVEPGQFALPHSVAVDGQNRVYIADRENCRIQVFDRDGKFLSQCSNGSWPGILWPNDVRIGSNGEIYVAEAGHRISIWKMGDDPQPTPIITPAGTWELLARWGDAGSGPGQFLDCPHSICVDSAGSVYTAEVPFHPGRLHKYERL